MSRKGALLEEQLNVQNLKGHPDPGLPVYHNSLYGRRNTLEDFEHPCEITIIYIFFGQ